MDKLHFKFGVSAIAHFILRGGAHLALLRNGDRKVKEAANFINLTDSCIHKYNEVSGVKGDFYPIKVKDKVALAELLKRILSTVGDIYVIVNDEETAEKLFGDSLEHVAIVKSKEHGRRDEDITSLSWGADHSFDVRFCSCEICV